MSSYGIKMVLDLFSFIFYSLHYFSVFILGGEIVDREAKIDTLKKVVEDAALQYPLTRSENGLGRLGVLAAKLGYREKANEILVNLEALKKREMLRYPAMLGEIYSQQARIKANLGEINEAMQLLHNAVLEGYPYNRYSLHLHRHPYWEPLRDNKEFMEFLRPKG